MICNRLNWDSEFFDIEVAEIDYNEVKNIGLLNLENYDLIYLYNCLSKDISIPQFELKYQETKVIFTKKLQDQNIQFNNLILDTDSSPLSNEKFYPLAFESGKHSRFKLDPKFQSKKFRELYIKWVDNSINKQFADKVFYILQEDKVVGFVTVKKHQALAKIGLIAVDSNSQGEGFGSILIEHVENYCIENELFELHIPTQKENILACKFYSKLGYSIKKEINIKHFWKS